MQTIQQECGGQSGPPLGLLQLELTVNATDSQLIRNLEYCKSLDIPEIQLMMPNKKTLAIVGSGPSLKETWKLIPPDAEIMALNGAYKFLRKQGLVPAYFAMLDARNVNTNFLEDLHQDTTYLIASQCQQAIFDTLSPFMVGMFHLGTPTTKKIFPNAECYVGGGGTIGLTAISLAVALGYRSVILYGLDSSFEGEQRHVQFQPQNANQPTIEVWVEDRKYVTTHAMAAQAQDFFPFWEAVQKEFPGFQLQVIGKGLFYDFVCTNNNPSTRERELSKYADAYKQPDYGMSKERYDGILRIVSDIKGVSYLDVSTGRGETLEIARKCGFNIVSGTETVDALLNEHVRFGILPALPIPDKYFDVVSLFEVIEHLVPGDIGPSLQELTRIAKKHILISAAVAQHWIGGVNLHPSARPVEQWDELFHQVWGDKVYRVGNLGSSPVWRVDLSVVS